MSTSGPSFGERAEFSESDVCYRHPGRQSFTLCQRCGRTICGECQVVSPVGVLCRDCVKQTAGAKSAKGVTRKARVAGRRVAMMDAPVTMSIIVLTLVVFVAQYVSYRFGNDSVTSALRYGPLYSVPPGLHEVPAGTLTSYPQGARLDATFEPWRMLTVMFTHSVGFLPHILFNMFGLYLFGRSVESMIGRARFLVLYLLAGLGGSLGSMLWVYVQPDALLTPMVGASGAVFGIFAAAFVALKAMQVDVRSLAVMLAINLGIGFIPGAAIAWQAHVGGMIVGALVMWIIVRTRGPRNRTKQVLALVGVAAVLVALAFAYFAVLPF